MKLTKEKAAQKVDFTKGVWVQELRSRSANTPEAESRWGEGPPATPSGTCHPVTVLKADAEGAGGPRKQGSIL